VWAKPGFRRVAEPFDERCLHSYHRSGPIENFSGQISSKSARISTVVETKSAAGAQMRAATEE
jgi:hypothetical protein